MEFVKCSFVDIPAPLLWVRQVGWLSYGDKSEGQRDNTAETRARVKTRLIQKWVGRYTKKKC